MCLNKFMFKYVLIIILATLFIGLLLPQVVLAADCSKGLVPCGRDCNNNGKIDPEEECGLCHIFIMIQTLLNGIGLIVAGWAVIFIVIGGIVIMAAGGSPEKAALGKKMITYAIIGIIVAFTAWIAINMIMNELVNPEKMPWPWNKIECKPGEPIGEEKKGEYCVCETPVYDLNPNQDSNAGIIGTNVKETNLSSQTECLQKCVAANASTYCRPSLKPQTAMYCADATELKNKSACTLYLKTTSINCQVATTCFNSENECLNAAKTTYKNRCYLDGQLLCQCYTGQSKGLCGNSTTKYVLYRIKQETPSGGTSLWDCNNASPYYCRLECKYDKCAEEKTSWCNEVKDSFSCFGGKFTCKNMTTGQEGDACYALKQFLNCMGSKNMPDGAKVISSISDNSKYKCFDTNYWDEKGKCSDSTDSCTGTCCGHSKSSLHYGGKANNVSCRQCSWAVDFANEQYYQGIKNVAEVCAEQLNYGKVDVIKEGNHVHLELEGVAKTLRCL